MNEFELLGPRAYGEALGQAVLKAIAEDFQVDEVLDIPLAGEGEHLWLWVEKRELNTEEAARRLARAAGVPVRTISYAGLKDRQALTRQWFSLHLPGKADPDLSAAENPSLRILKSMRHKRKLQRARIRPMASPCASRAWSPTTRRSMPGSRRWRPAVCPTTSARSASAMTAAMSSMPVLSPAVVNCRNSATSALGCYRPVAATCSTGCSPSGWPRANGTVPRSATCWPSPTSAASSWRARRSAATPPGDSRPAPHRRAVGFRAVPCRRRHGALEQALADAEPALRDWLADAGMAHERRILRLPIGGLTWHYPEPDVLQLEFVLPAGCFATAVVRELVDLVPAGQTDNPCVF